MAKIKRKKIEEKKDRKERKEKEPRTRKKMKVTPDMIGIGTVLLILAILFYFLFDIWFAIIFLIGELFILGFSHLLHKFRKNKIRRRILNIILILFFSIAILVCLGASAFIIKIVQDAPEFDISRLTKKEATILLDCNDEEYDRIGELRENVTYDDLPEVFIDALIATEDSRYFQHNGFDAPRFIVASIKQLLGDKKAGGASTLSMQLITNTYTDRNVNEGIEGIMRKFTDIYLAVFKLEKNYTKEQIIEYYVNNYDLSNNSYGVEQASQTYFGKSVSDLNLSEAALLVGIFNAPTYYNPFLNPYRAYVRRGEVLDLMVRHGYITQEECNMAQSIPITSLLADKQEAKQYEAYTNTVINELKDKYGINPYTTPLVVHTNLIREKQQGLDEIFNGNTKYKWINDKVQSGVAVIDVKTGKIVAIGAGRNRKATDLNLATSEPNQIGSTAKPIFDYGPAIEYLGWDTYTRIVDEPWQYSSGQSVNNSSRDFWGVMSIRTALAQSRNIPALKAFQQVQSTVGNKKILEFANNLGLTPSTENGQLYESAALGAIDGVTVLQMAAAYAAFANGGTYIEPLAVNKIVYRENNDVRTFKGKETKAMSEATAFMITDMLLTAVNNGLSSGAKINGVNLAAKTGTTNFSEQTINKYNMKGIPINDAWIVGYDPEYSVAMWYGYTSIDDGYLEQNSAVLQRGKLYQAIGNAIFEKDGKIFTEPSSVKKVCVEAGSWPASLPSAGTPQDQITCEYFHNGSEPTEVSSKYNKLSTVKNLNVSYDEANSQITLTWSSLNAPTTNESFGRFGYHVYYGDVLLGFTDTNSYTIQANTNISGTYKVVTTFENYSGNQSDPAIFNFTYHVPTPTPTTTPNTSPSPSPTTTPKPSSSPETTNPTP